jgi:hypothetical protein
MLESKASFARRMAWNRSTVTRYAAAGKIVVTQDGMVDVEASKARLAASADPLKEGVRHRHREDRRARGRDAGGEEEGGSLRADPNDTSYQALTRHRAAAEYNRAELLRLELAEREGRLVDAEAVRRRALQLASAAGDAIMNLRYRLDPLLSGEADPAKRAEIWDRELRQIREELARGVETPLASSATGE